MLILRGITTLVALLVMLYVCFRRRIYFCTFFPGWLSVCRRVAVVNGWYVALNNTVWAARRSRRNTDVQGSWCVLRSFCCRASGGLDDAFEVAGIEKWRRIVACKLALLGLVSKKARHGEGELCMCVYSLVFLAHVDTFGVYVFDETAVSPAGV